MGIFRRPGRLLAIGSAAVVLVAAGITVGALNASASASADPPYVVHPLMKQYAKSKPAALPPPSVCVAAYGLACYSPQEIRSAYNVPSTYQGQGEKIAIIDAYGDPTVESDLANFSAYFGLPAADLHVYCPRSCDWPLKKASDQDLAYNWAGEISLDVQWAHAIAPLATINLVIAKNSTNSEVNKALQYAVDNDLGDVISMSYGTDEAAMHGNNALYEQEHRTFLAADAKNISLFASAGDGGAADGYAVANAGNPASDPLVTSVGGTNLFITDAGAYGSETVWNDDDASLCPFGCTIGPIGGTGGAVSTLFATPAYQTGVTGQSMRAVSDVSYNASVYTAVMVFVGYYPDDADNGLYFFGGTSSGSPQWAAIGALADQAAGHRLGQLNPRLYGLAANPTSYAANFHDVTVGNNAFAGPGYPAGAGWDIPTGLGSPNVANLIDSLKG